MAQYGVDNYSVLMNFNGNGLTQEHLINVNGSNGENVGMYFTGNGDGSVKIQNPTNAIGFFPISQFQGFLETLRFLVDTKGALVVIDERSSSIRIGSQGSLS